jgi:hypothetical protein
MGLEDNVLLIRSVGGECFICDVKIKPQEIAIEVNFKFPLFITTATVRKEAHLSCSADLGIVLNKRLNEAGYRRYKGMA